ncbi:MULTISPECIES: GTP-binding protein [unclassified Romboutsia]|uniref:GTP-binding protein n=1 Tax=unclassified Romboutsia TaxID=2626894 RepID=UPI000F05884B|nr:MULTISPECIES: TetM/TetW/TetO/TetS family tetracycline resistance ribosomal protection protein [unclassified Romboutsia]
MNKTIGILAHVDAGKTTFCEQVLYHTNSIRKLGRVDHKDTFLDNHNIEKSRGITIFSSQGNFKYKGCEYNLIDTPGHIDFSPEMERSINIIDYAVLIISGVEKVQSHTKTVFRLLKEYNVPVFIFVNKMDRTGANIDSVLNDIKLNLSCDIVDISNSLDIKNNYDLDENLIEFIAERDDILFEKYLDEYYDKDMWINKLKEEIKNCEVYPCCFGSALNNIGIDSFLDKLDFLTTTNYCDEGEFVGIVYKVIHDENKNRITFIKGLKGSLKVKDEIKYNNINEKINQIRIYNGEKFITENTAKGGQLFAVTGLNNANIGDYIFSNDFEESKIKFYNTSTQIQPNLKVKVIFDKSFNINEVYSYFKILNSEEPSLNVFYDDKLKEISVHIMGKIQLEILKDIVKERFNLDIEFGQCEILYKETINKETNGYGHFEPLGHYAEVHIIIEPSNRNSGISFESKALVDNLQIGHQNLVKTHIFEREHRGILGGYPLTDIKITLINGRAHNKHTSGGDFREATFRALRQGIEKVENILLEPYYKFRIEISLDYIGRVLSDIQKMSGEFEEPQIINDRSIIKGRGPVSTFMDYSMELLSFSKGTGSIQYIQDGYDVCHNSEEVLEKRNYNKDADIDYTSSSIFCSKGQAYRVDSDEVENHMHCL